MQIMGGQYSILQPFPHLYPYETPSAQIYPYTETPRCFTRSYLQPKPHFGQYWPLSILIPVIGSCRRRLFLSGNWNSELGIIESTVCRITTSFSEIVCLSLMWYIAVEIFLPQILHTNIPVRESSTSSPKDNFLNICSITNPLIAIVTNLYKCHFQGAFYNGR